MIDLVHLSPLGPCIASVNFFLAWHMDRSMGEVPVHQKLEDFSGGNVVKNRLRFTHAPWASKDKFENSSEESPGARLI